jgi:hypothetical protein
MNIAHVSRVITPGPLGPADHTYDSITTRAARATASRNESLSPADMQRLVSSYAKLHEKPWGLNPGQKRPILRLRWPHTARNNPNVSRTAGFILR